MKNIIFALVLFAIGIISLLLRNKGGTTAEKKKKWYFTKEEEKVHRIILGIGMIIAGFMVLFQSCHKLV